MDSTFGGSRYHRFAAVEDWRRLRVASSGCGHGGVADAVSGLQGSVLPSGTGNLPTGSSWAIIVHSQHPCDCRTMRPALTGMFAAPAGWLLQGCHNTRCLLAALSLTLMSVITAASDSSELTTSTAHACHASDLSAACSSWSEASCPVLSCPQCGAYLNGICRGMARFWHALQVLLWLQDCLVQDGQC